MNKARSKKGWLRAKTDFSKAFDRVEWNFLRAILRKLGFLEKFIHWIMQCTSTPMFSILLNGSPKGFFGAQRGSVTGRSSLTILVHNIYAEII